MSYPQEQLRAAVDSVFFKFDKDGSNSLDPKEVANLLNAAFAHLNAGKTTSQEEVNALIASTDRDADGKISKAELYDIFEKMVNS